MPQSTPRGGFRRCSSVPSLSGMAIGDANEGEGLDVYVALRPFYCKLPLVDGLKVSTRVFVSATLNCKAAQPSLRGTIGAAHIAHQAAVHPVMLLS